MKKILLLLMLVSLQQSWAQLSGNALNFDGVDDRVTVLPVSVINGSFTVEAWVRPTEAIKNMHIFSTRNYSDLTFDIQILNGNKIHGDIGNGSSWITTTADADYNYLVNYWFHLAYVVTPTGYSIYVNGVMLGSGTFSGTPLLLDGGHYMEIGSNAPYNTYYKGDIDGVRLYNVALSQSTIISNMTNPSNTNCFAAYNFNFGTAGGNNTAGGYTTMPSAINGSYQASASGFAFNGSTSNLISTTVATVTPGNVNYTSLKAAIDAINAGTHTGAVTVSIVGDSRETAGSVLNASGTGSASYSSVTIRPSGDQARTITGSINGPLLTVKGSQVTINGINAFGNSLTLSNISTAVEASTVYFSGSSTGNTITGCTVLGASFADSYSGGTIVLQPDDNGSGIDNLTISYCNIGPAGTNFPAYAIRAIRSNNTLSTGLWAMNNNIYDYFKPADNSMGISTDQGFAGISITGNKFYQTTQKTFTGYASHYGINISDNQGAYNHYIADNTFGYANAGGTGVYQLVYAYMGSSNGFTAIKLSASNSLPSVIQNNTFTGISVTTAFNIPNAVVYAFKAIDVETASATITGNTIGSQTDNTSISVNGIGSGTMYVIGIDGGNRNSSASGNFIGGFNITSSGGATFQGIGYINSTSGNTIGSALPNSITINTTTGGRSYGLVNSIGETSYTNNTIRNITVSGGTGYLEGIDNGAQFSSANGTTNYIGNTIYNLEYSSTSGILYVHGISSYRYSSTTTVNILRNKIYNLKATSSASSNEIVGVDFYDTGSGLVTMANNMIALGNGLNADAIIHGINLSSQNRDVALYHNSIYIGGNSQSGNKGSSPLYCLLNSGTNQLYIKNNIFANFRTNSGGSAINYAINAYPAFYYGTFEMDYNLYYNMGDDFGYYNNTKETFAAWQSGSGRDSHSYFSDPQFADPTAATPDLHLKPSAGNVAEGYGIAIPGVTDDFDGETRSSLTPTDIGADAGNFTVLPAPVITGFSVSEACVGASLTINGQYLSTVTSASIGGVSVAVTGTTLNSVTVTLVTGATGTVALTSAAGTTTSAATFITRSPSVIETLPPASVTACTDGYTEISGICSQAASYQWMDWVTNTPIANSPPFSNANTNSLSITYPDSSYHNKRVYLQVTSIYGCITNAPSTIIFVRANPSISVTADNPAICIGSSTGLRATGATNYTWSPATGLNLTTGSVVNASPTETTTYTVIGTTVGCPSLPQTVTITVNPKPDVVISPAAPVICQTSSVVLTASGASTYTWSPSTGLSATTGNTVTCNTTSTRTYTVTGTDANGCVNTKTVTVTVNTLPNIGISNNITICEGNSTTLTATGGTSYSWSPATGLSSTTASSVTASPTTTTTYTVIGSDNNGCSRTRTVTVTVNPAAELALSASNDFFCPGGTTTLTVSGGASSYSWSPATGLNQTIGASVIATVSDTRTYIVTGTYANGCQRTKSITITTLPLPDLIVSPNVTICPGSSTTLTASGAVTYSWSPTTGLDTTTGPSVIANPSETTTYTVTATGANGCITSSTVTVTIEGILLKAQSSDYVICAGQSATLTASGGTSYNWTPVTGFAGSTGASVTISPLVTTTYTVSCITANGCSQTAIVTVIVKPDPVIAATGPTTYCNGGSVNLGIVNDNNAVQFDGVNDFANIIRQIGDDFTIEFWMKTTQTGTGTQDWHSGKGIVDAEVSGNVNDFGTALVGNKLSFGIGGGGGGTDTSILSTSNVNTGDWIHVAATRNKASGLIQLFINGVLENYIVQDNHNSLTTTPVMRIGGILTGTGYFNGNLDDIRMWNTVRTQAEIQAGMDAVFTTGTPGLINYYKFDEISGTTAINTANTSVNATLQNGPVRTKFRDYTYSWSNGLTTSQISATQSGAYSLQTTETDGCVITTNTINVTVNPLPSISVTPNVAFICPGSGTTLTASGAATYSWSPSTGLSATTGATVTASPSVTRTYTVTGTDANGCVSSATVTVNVVNTVVTATASDYILCPGESAVLTANGASTYIWSPSTGLSATTGTAVTASPTETTTYTITGTDIYGCTDTENITVTVKPRAVITPLDNISLCAGESVTLASYDPMLTMDGVDDYFEIGRNIADDFTIEFRMKTAQLGNHIIDQWYAGTGLIDGEVGGNVNDFGIALLGTKLAFGVGGGGIHSDVTLISPTNINTGQWVHVAVTRSKMTGELRMYIDGVDNGSVISPNTFSLNSPSVLRVGGLATGGWHYNGSIDDIRIWNVVKSQSEIIADKNTVFRGNTTGLTAYFRFSEGSGTTAINTVNAANNGTLQNGPVYGRRSVVNGTFLWSTGETTPEITVNTAGSYTLTSNDGDGCITTSAPVAVTVNALPVVSISTPDNNICLGSSTTLTANGATTYTWSPATGLDTAVGSEVVASPSVTTTYTVTGTNVNGCVDTDTITVTVHNPTISASAADPIICPGSSTTLTANGAADYTWSPATGLSSVSGASVTASPLVTTTYTVTGNDCTGNTTVTITVHPEMSLDVTATETTICSGSGTTLTTFGAASYSWSPSTGLNTTTGDNVIATPSVTTTYTVTGTDGNGCTSTKSILITVHPEVIMTLSTSANAICSGTSSILTASGAVSYTWSPSTGLNTTTGPQVVATPATATTYTVTGIDAYGCTHVESTTITPQSPSITIANIGSLYCPDSNVTLSASGGVSYSWSPSTGLNTTTGNVVIASPLTTTVYTVTGIDALGCSSTANITVNIKPSPMSVSASSENILPGETVSLTASGANVYSWSLSSSLSVIAWNQVLVNPLTTTTYTVTGTDDDGCDFTQSITINVDTVNPVIVPAGPTTVCDGTSVTLDVSPMSHSNAIHFNGVDQSAQINNSLSWSYTVEFWMKTTQVGSNTGTQWYDGTGIFDAEVPGNLNDYGVTLLGDKIAFGTGGAGLSPDGTIISNTSVNTGEWVHVAVTRNVSNYELKIYINGVLDTTGYNFITLQTGASPVVSIGKLLYGNGYFEGSIDELRTWNKVKSEAEIRAEMSMTLPSGNSLMDDIRFEDISSGAATNAASPSNPVQLSGNPGTDTRPVYYQSYLWSDGSTTKSIDAATEGDYTVTVTNGNYSATSPITAIVFHDSPNVTVLASNNIISAGDTVQLTASGADSYSWSPSTGLSATTGENVIASPLVTTTYTVTGTSAEGCSATANVTITVAAAGPYIIANGPTSICEGGSVQLSAYTGYDSPALNFDGNSIAYTNNNTPDDFTMECWIKANYIANPNPPYWFYGRSIIYALAPDGANSFGISILGDKLAFGIGDVPENQMTITSITNVTTNEWIHVAVNRDKNSGEVKLYINGNEEASAFFPNTNSLTTNFMSICPFTAAAVDEIRFWGNVRTQPEIAANRYADFSAGATSLTDYYPLNENGLSPVSNPVNSVNNWYLSGSENWTMRRTVPLTYLWSTGQTTPDITVSDAGNYTVQVINTGGFTETSAPITISHQTLTITALAADSIICPSGSTTLTASGADIYNWSPTNGLSSDNGDTVTASPSVTTTYTVTGTSASGCIDTTTVTVNVNKLEVTASTTQICPSGSSLLTASGMDTYSWSPSTGLSSTTGTSVTANPSVTTTYTVTGETAEGCILTKDITITITSLQANITSSGTTSSCTEILTATVGSDSSAITFSGNEVAIFNGNTAADFTLECWIKTNATTPSLPVNTAWNQGYGIMSGTNATGISLVNNKLAFGIRGAGAGAPTTIYSTSSVTTNEWIHIAATRQRNTGILKLYINGIEEASGVAANTSNLALNQMVLGALGDFMHLYNGSLDEFRYWTTVRTAQEIADNMYTSYPPATFGLYNSIKFNDGSGTVAANTAFASNVANIYGDAVWTTRHTIPLTYLWSNGAVTPSITAGTSGNYSVQISSPGCMETSPVRTVTLSTASLTLSSSGNTICAGESATVTASGGGGIYQWTPSTGITALNNYTVTAAPPVTTTYTVTSTLPSGCIGSQTITITVNPVVSLSASADKICPGGSVTLTASGDSGYIWSPTTGLSATTGANVTASPTVTTTYTVTTDSPTGCNTKSVTITVNDLNPSIVASGPTTICPGAPIDLTAFSSFDSHAVSVNGEDLMFTDGPVISDFTVEGWIKTTNTSSPLPANAKWYEGKGIISGTYNSANAYGIALVNNKIAFGVNGGNNMTIISQSSVATGQWVHVAVSRVKATGEMKLYINGNLEASGTTTNTADLYSALAIGATMGDYSKLYYGSLDDIRFWNTVRTPSQIQNNMNGVTPGASGLVRYYPMNEGTGNYVNDVISPSIYNRMSYFGSSFWTVRNNSSQTYLWSNGETTPSISVNTAGDYSVQISNPNCGTNTSPTITTTLQQVVVGTVSADQSVCYGSYASDITVTGNSGSVWGWEFDIDPNFTNASYVANGLGTLTGAELGVISAQTYVRAYIITSCGYYTTPVVSLSQNGTTTWNGSAWSNGTPTSNVSAIISGNYSSTADLWACSLTVNNNAVVTINDGNDFNVFGKVTVDNGSTLTINNNANLLQTLDVANSGQIILKKNASMVRQDYVYWSSPVAGQNLHDFSSGTLPTRFYTIDESTNGFVWADPEANSFEMGTGYSIRAPNNFQNPPALPQPFTGIFKGVPNNGDIDIPVTKVLYGYNLIGNPYPSGLDAMAFLAENPGTLYFWTHRSQAAVSGANYASLNTTGATAAVTGGNAPNGIISAGQGFILLRNSSGTAHFSNDMRSGNTGAFYRTAGNEKHRIWLNLNSPDSGLNQMLVGYVEGATDDADISIDGRLAENGSTISSIIANENYVIQGKALPFEDTDIVPLNFKALTAGTYTIAIDHVDGLFTGDQDIFIKDNLLGIVQSIKTTGYTFASAEGTFAQRFELVFQNSPLGTETPVFDENKVVLYKENGIFQINSGTTVMDNVKIFDVRGRLIYERNDINTQQVSLDDFRAEQEVLLVKITSDENKTVTKKAVY